MTPEQIEKLRAQFESWIKSPPYERLAVRFPETDATWPGSYRAIDIDLAWQAWQECARLVAQDTWERAAKVCEAADMWYFDRTLGVMFCQLEH